PGPRPRPLPLGSARRLTAPHDQPSRRAQQRHALQQQIESLDGVEPAYAEQRRRLTWCQRLSGLAPLCRTAWRERLEVYTAGDDTQLVRRQPIEPAQRLAPVLRRDAHPVPPPTHPAP